MVVATNNVLIDILQKVSYWTTEIIVPHSYSSSSVTGSKLPNSKPVHVDGIYIGFKSSDF
jgi:hypothetical protein